MPYFGGCSIVYVLVPTYEVNNLFGIFFFSLETLKGQNLNGIVKDTAGNWIPGANVWVIKDRDTLHSITNEFGSFSFSNFEDSVFVIKVTCIGFKPFEQKISGGNNDISIILKSSFNLLNEIVIRGRVPMVIKGDTTEFNARAYQAHEDDVVQDLLSKLPGIIVDKDGNLSMMGQPITRVRVNGQDYLLSNIKDLTTLLAAKYIDKLQIIDDYGDLAGRAGRKTGIASKVLNLQTKPNIATLVNSRIGLSYNCFDNYYQVSGQHSIYNKDNHLIASLNNSNLGVLPGNGVATRGNIDFGRKLGDKLGLVINVDGDHVSSSQSSISSQTSQTSNGILYNQVNGNSYSKSKHYKLNSEVRFDAEKDLFTAKIVGEFNNDNTSNIINSTQSGYQNINQITSSYNRSRLSNFTSQILGIHNFSKKGQSISILLDYGFKDLSQPITDNSEYKYLTSDGTLIRDSLLYQEIEDKKKEWKVNFEASFIQPIDDNNSVELKYGIQNTSSNNLRRVQYLDEAGKFNLIDSLSQTYRNQIFQQKILIDYQRKTKRIDYTIGGLVTPYLLLSSTNISGVFFMPVIQLDYRGGAKTNITLFYQGNSVFPTFDQLKPIPDFTNIQFPIYGNPELRAGQQHELKLAYRKGGVSSLFFNLFGNTIRNQVVTNIISVTDSLNTVRQETHFLNSSGNYTLGEEFLWSRAVGEKNSHISTSLSSSYNVNRIYFNNSPYKVSNLLFKLSFKSDFNFEWLTLFPSLSYSLNRNVYTVNGNEPINLHSLRLEGYSLFRLPSDFLFELSFNNQYNFGYNSTYNVNNLIVNINLIKRWWKNRFTCALGATNLFNVKNLSSQSISGNTISTTQTNRVGRVILLSLIFQIQQAM